jgi:ATP-dependent helicase IRC3
LYLVTFHNIEAENEAHFQAYFTPAMLHKGTAAVFKMSPFMRSRKVLTAANLSDAVRGCDTYAKTKVVFGPMTLGSGFNFWSELSCYVTDDHV